MIAAFTVAGLAALAYAILFLERKSSVARTVVKTVAVGALAAGVWLSGGPVALAFGLTVSALGDAFLAGDPKRWLPFGLASFFAGHVAYILLFAPLVVWPPAIVSLVAVGVALAAAAAMLAWLWGSLGALRLPVIGYVAVIAGMVSASLILPGERWLATLGALAFFASDALLSIQLFKRRFETPLGAQGVWWLYALGQAGIAAAFWRG